MAPDRRLDAVLARHATRLMALPGVVGVGEGLDDGRPCLVVLVSRDAAGRPELPAEVEGYPVVARLVEPLRAQPSR